MILCAAQLATIIRRCARRRPPAAARRRPPSLAVVIDALLLSYAAAARAKDIFLLLRQYARLFIAVAAAAAVFSCYGLSILTNINSRCAFFCFVRRAAAVDAAEIFLLAADDESSIWTLAAHGQRPRTSKHVRCESSTAAARTHYTAAIAFRNVERARANA